MVARLWRSATAVPVRHGRRTGDAPLKVLSVEDDPSNVELMQGLLESRPTASLQVVGDGAAAIAAAARWKPALVLLDLNLPGGLDGFAVLQALRADPANAGLHCVAVTANAMAREIQRAHAAGFDDYLVKPFQADRLFALLTRYGG